jgi:hypothetical protein
VGNLPRERQQHPAAGIEVHDCIQLFAHRLTAPANIRLNRNFACYAQGKVSHIGRRVPHLAVLQGLQQLQGRFHHDLALGCDAFTMEWWLHQAALPAPEFTLTGQQPPFEQLVVRLKTAPT